MEKRKLEIPEKTVKETNVLTIPEAVVEKKKKVCIMGFAPSWTKTPFENPEFEIWSLNEAYELLKQVPNGKGGADRWFEIHSPHSPSKNKPKHHAFLANCNIPLYMWQHFPEFPTSIPYPLQQVVERFGSKYFTNSISYMVALSLLEGFEEIWITGVDMACDSEYQTQRASVEWWIGLAQGMGVKVYIPDDSDLLKCSGLYGFESDNTIRLKYKNRIKELEGRKKQTIQQIKMAEEQLEQMKASVYAMDGAIGENNFYLKNWSY